MRLRRLMGFVCALALSVFFPIARPAARAAGAAARADEADRRRRSRRWSCPLRKAAHRYRSAAGAQLDGESVRIGEEGSAAVTFEAVPGTYALVIEYDPLPESTQNVQLALRIDGAAPSRGAENIVLRRRWRDKPGAQREDGRGNDIRLPQEEILFAERGWLTATATDSTGYENGPLLFALGGTHTLEITVQQSAVRIRSLRFVQPVQASTYAEYAAVHAGAADAGGLARTNAGGTDGVEERSDPVCRGGPQYPRYYTVERNQNQPEYDRRRKVDVGGQHLGVGGTGRTKRTV